MLTIVTGLALGCASDVSIMKRDYNSDTDITDPSLDTQNPEDSAQTQPDNDTNTSDQMTELTSGFANIHFRQIACPACVGAPSEFDIKATLKLHYPTSGEYTNWLTPVGTCTTNLIQSYVSNQPLPSTQPAYFNAVAMNPSSTGEWTNGLVYEYQYERNTSYDVNTEHGNFQGIFESLEGFDSIEPYTLLWVDPSYAFDAVISKSSGAYFTWYPVLQNSTFEILIAVYSPDGSQLLGQVSCMENDVGYMTIPASYFSSFPVWSLAAVHLSRHRVNRVAAPALNGYIESHMQWEVVGTAHIE